MFFLSLLIGCLSGAISHQPTTFRTRAHKSALVSMGMSRQLAYMAMAAYKKAKDKAKKPYFMVVDYSLPSHRKRLWVIDMSKRKKLLYHTHVAHGQGSDVNHDGKMEAVSNIKDSNATSVGLMRTAESYKGKFGLAVRLDGLEDGFNDQARRRGIVIHAADYMTPAWFQNHGAFGRSLGCPALAPDIAADVMKMVRNGSLFFGYFPDKNWVETSHFL